MDIPIITIRNPNLLKLVAREKLAGGDKKMIYAAERLLQQACERNFAERLNTDVRQMA